MSPNQCVKDFVELAHGCTHILPELQRLRLCLSMRHEALQQQHHQQQESAEIRGEVRRMANALSR